MDDRRRLKRRHLIYYLRVFDADTGDILGHIIDIHTQGFLLISEQPIVTGKQCTLRMVLPTEINHNRDITFQASSVWSKPDIIPAFYNTGFKFQSIAPDTVETVRQLIHQFGLQDIWD